MYRVTPYHECYCTFCSIWWRVLHAQFQKRVQVIVVQFCRKFAKNSWTMFYYWWIDLFFDVLANFLIRHVPPCEYWIRLKGKLSENQYDSNRNMVVWLYHLVNNLLLIIKWRGSIFCIITRCGKLIYSMLPSEKFTFHYLFKSMLG